MIDKPIFEFIPPQGTAGPPKSTGIPITAPGSPYLGYYVADFVVNPPGKETDNNRYFEYNYTGTPGKGSGLFYSLMFQLPKWQYAIAKADEWISVSPTHTEYYQRTLAQKQELERVIKSGLASAASAVADYELVKHDMRKYKEILNYFAAKDEHSLKAMFIDNVDVHTDQPGQPISLRTIAPRWPTIIADFMRLEDKDVDPDAISKKLDIAKTEAVILATKNKLYLEWKVMFREAVSERYVHLKGLVEARKKSIKEYREWIKPYISKFKMLRSGHEIKSGGLGTRSGMLRSFADITGQKTYSNFIRIWAWKSFKPVESRKPVMETKGKKFVADPYDRYIRDYLILNPKTGLAGLYPWLLKKERYKKGRKGYKEIRKFAVNGKVTRADNIVHDVLDMFTSGSNALNTEYLYYVIWDIQVKRMGAVLQTGELEDITFYVRPVTCSQNIMLLKLLELECRNREFEYYIEEMLGTKIGEEEIKEFVKREYPTLYEKDMKPKKVTPFGKEFESMKRDFQKLFNAAKSIRMSEKSKIHFIRPGPYEVTYKERMTKQYLTPMGARTGAMAEWLRKKSGVK